MEIPKESIEYLSKYYPITNLVSDKIKKHIKRYSLSGDICAYYIDWKDFCSDWCNDLSYTKKEAKKLLHGGKGEFQIIKDYGIIRYSL